MKLKYDQRKKFDTSPYLDIVYKKIVEHKSIPRFKIRQRWEYTTKFAHYLEVEKNVGNIYVKYSEKVNRYKKDKEE